MTAKVPDGSAQAADAFAEAHARLLADRTIQFEMPRVDPDPPRDGPNWLSGLVDFLNSPAMSGIFWVVVVLVAIFILYLIALRFAGFQPPWRRGSQDEEEDSDLRPEASVARQLLDEADALARQGRFSEAAHLLLHRSIEDIDHRRPELLRPALTSRDIAALPGLPDQPRTAFARIAMLVERSLFARRPLARDDWEDCRVAYERFAFADGWRG